MMSLEAFASDQCAEMQAVDPLSSLFDLQSR